MRKFNSANWFAEIGRARGSFTALDSLVGDKATIDSHLGRDVTEDPASKLAAGFRKVSLNEAHAIHRRQMIVLAVTILEGAVQDFLRSLFESHPARMHQFIGPEQSRGTVKLSAIESAADKKDLVAELASEAAQRIGRMKYRRVLNHIQELSKSELGTPLDDDLIELFEERHRIVHEVSTHIVSSQRVTDVLYSLSLAVKFLERAAEANDVPVFTEVERMRLALGGLTRQG